MRFYRRPPATDCHPQLAPLPMAQFSYLPSPYQPSRNASGVGQSRLAPPVLSQLGPKATDSAQELAEMTPTEFATFSCPFSQALPKCLTDLHLYCPPIRTTSPGWAHSSA